MRSSVCMCSSAGKIDASTKGDRVTYLYDAIELLYRCIYIYTARYGFRDFFRAHAIVLKLVFFANGLVARKDFSWLFYSWVIALFRVTYCAEEIHFTYTEVVALELLENYIYPKLQIYIFQLEVELSRCNLAKSSSRRFPSRSARDSVRKRKLIYLCAYVGFITRQMQKVPGVYSAKCLSSCIIYLLAPNAILFQLRRST